jgi:hypothetical protein
VRVLDGPVLIIADAPAALDPVGVAVDCLRVMMDLTKLAVRGVLGRMLAAVMVGPS